MLYTTKKKLKRFGRNFDMGHVRSPFAKGAVSAREKEEFELLRQAVEACYTGIEFSWKSIFALDVNTGKPNENGGRLPPLIRRDHPPATYGQLSQMHASILRWSEERANRWWGKGHANGSISLLLRFLVQEVDHLSSLPAKEDALKRVEALHTFLARLLNANGSDIFVTEYSDGEDSIYELLQNLQKRTPVLEKVIKAEIAKEAIRDKIERLKAARRPLRVQFSTYIFHSLANHEFLQANEISSDTFVPCDSLYEKLFKSRRNVLFHQVLYQDENNRVAAGRSYEVAETPDGRLLNQDGSVNAEWLMLLSQVEVSEPEPEQKEGVEQGKPKKNVLLGNKPGFPDDIFKGDKESLKEIVELFIRLNGLLEIFDEYNQKIDTLSDAAGYGGDATVFGRLPEFLKRTLEGSKVLNLKIRQTIQELEEVIKGNAVLKALDDDRNHNFKKHHDTAKEAFRKFKQHQITYENDLDDLLRLFNDSNRWFDERKGRILRKLCDTVQNERQSTEYVNGALGLQGDERIEYVDHNEPQNLSEDLELFQQEEKKRGVVLSEEEEKYPNGVDADVRSVSSIESENFRGQLEEPAPGEAQFEIVDVMPASDWSKEKRIDIKGKVASFDQMLVDFFGEAQDTSAILKDVPSGSSWFRGRQARFLYLNRLAGNLGVWQGLIQELKKFREGLESSGLYSSRQLWAIVVISNQIKEEIRHIDACNRSLHFWNGLSKRKMNLWRKRFTALENESAEIEKKVESRCSSILWKKADSALKAGNFEQFFETVDYLDMQQDELAGFTASFFGGRKLSEKACNTMLKQAKASFYCIASTRFAIVCADGEDNLAMPSMRKMMRQYSSVLEAFAKGTPRLARRLANFYFEYRRGMYFKKAVHFLDIAIVLGDKEALHLLYARLDVNGIGRPERRALLGVLNNRKTCRTKDIFELAEMAKADGNKEKEIEYFQKVLASDDKTFFSRAQWELANIYLEKGDESKVEEVLQNFNFSPPGYDKLNDWLKDEDAEHDLEEKDIELLEVVAKTDVGAARRFTRLYSASTPGGKNTEKSMFYLKKAIELGDEESLQEAYGILDRRPQRAEDFFELLNFLFEQGKCRATDMFRLAALHKEKGAFAKAENLLNLLTWRYGSRYSDHHADQAYLELARVYLCQRDNCHESKSDQDDEAKSDQDDEEVDRYREKADQCLSEIRDLPLKALEDLKRASTTNHAERALFEMLAEHHGDAAYALSLSEKDSQKRKYFREKAFLLGSKEALFAVTKDFGCNGYIFEARELVKLCMDENSGLSFEDFRQKTEFQKKIIFAKYYFRNDEEDKAFAHLEKIHNWKKTDYSWIICADELAFRESDIVPDREDFLVLHYFIDNSCFRTGKYRIRVLNRIATYPLEARWARRKAVELGCIPHINKVLGHLLQDMSALVSADERQEVALWFFDYIFPDSQNMLPAVLSRYETLYRLAMFHEKDGRYDKVGRLLYQIKGKKINEDFLKILRDECSEKTEWILRVLSHKSESVSRMLFEEYALGKKLKFSIKKARKYFERSEGVECSNLYFSVVLVRLYVSKKRFKAIQIVWTPELDQWFIRYPRPIDKDFFLNKVQFALQSSDYKGLASLSNMLNNWMKRIRKKTTWHKSVREAVDSALIDLVMSKIDFETDELSIDEKLKLFNGYKDRFFKGKYAPMSPCGRYYVNLSDTLSKEDAESILGISKSEEIKDAKHPASPKPSAVFVGEKAEFLPVTADIEKIIEQEESVKKI